MNHAVLSCDTNPEYAFYLPIACLAWRLRGYRPLVLLAGEPGEWFGAPHLTLAVKRAREVGAEVYWVGGFEGVRSSTVAQCARIFAAAAPGVGPDDLLITSDVDMLPIGSWVGSGLDDSDRVHLYYANAYEGSDYVHFPMCYVAAKAVVWRRLVHVSRVDVMRDVSEVRSHLVEMLADGPNDSDGAWNWDEKWLGMRIDARIHLYGEESVRRADRTFVEGQWRIDRSDWDAAMVEMKKRGSLHGVADAHLIRPGYTEENWPRLRPLLEMLLVSEHLAWVESYRTAWCEVHP